MLSCETAGWRNLVFDLPSPSSPRKLPPSCLTATKGSAMSLMMILCHCRPLWCWSCCLLNPLVRGMVADSNRKIIWRKRMTSNWEKRKRAWCQLGDQAYPQLIWSDLPQNIFDQAYIPSTYLIRLTLKIFDQTYLQHIWSDLHTFNIFDQTYLQLIWSDLPSTYLIRLTFNFVQTNPISSLAPPPSLCPGSSTVISPLENKQNCR